MKRDEICGRLVFAAQNYAFLIPFDGEPNRVTGEDMAELLKEHDMDMAMRNTLRKHCEYLERTETGVEIKLKPH